MTAMVLPGLRTLRQRVVMPRLNRPDMWLIVATVGLVGIGIVMVFNASYFYGLERAGDPYLFLRKHVISIAIGAALAVAVSQVRLEWLERSAPILLVLAFVSLLFVLVPGIGVVRGGARRWVNLAGMSIQPSEWAKIAIVLYLAQSIVRRGQKMASFAYGVLPHLIIIGACMGLVVLQPDFGTTMILGMVMIAMIFVGGGRLSHLGALALGVLPVAIAGVMHESYRMRRIMAFRDPWRYSQDLAFQLVQSLIAFGSGGWTGVGLGESRQKLFFLPEAHTDFIFALVGEELGLIGALVVLALFAVLGVRGFRIAMRHPDPFGSLLAFGLTLVLLLEAVVNVGVVLGLLPTKGLALPFLSSGGTAMMVALVQVGMLAALSRQAG